MIDLKYSYNWNNKLSCQIHTTIRLRNDEKYFVDQQVTEIIKERKLQSSTIIAIKHLLLEDIDDFIAGLDTGYNAEKCKEIIQTMYKNSRIDWKVQQLSLILLQVDKATILIAQSDRDKIALFCSFYQKYIGIKYKPTGADAGKVKGVAMDDEMLAFYFESHDFKVREKSIGNYVKYYNWIRQMFANPQLFATAKFINEWDEEYARKLSPKDFTEYRQHLVKLGWMVNTRPGQKEHWTLKPKQQS